MANERDKDLPLVVSEILIEMHSTRQAVERLNDGFRRLAEITNQQQEHNNRLFKLMMEQNTQNAEFLAYTITKAIGGQQTQIEAHEQRIKRLEDKFSDR